MSRSCDINLISRLSVSYRSQRHLQRNQTVSLEDVAENLDNAILVGCMNLPPVDGVIT